MSDSIQAQWDTAQQIGGDGVECWQTGAQAADTPITANSAEVGVKWSVSTQSESLVGLHEGSRDINTYWHYTDFAMHHWGNGCGCSNNRVEGSNGPETGYNNWHIIPSWGKDSPKTFQVRLNADRTQIQYFVDSELIHTAEKAPSFPLYVDVSLCYGYIYDMQYVFAESAPAASTEATPAPTPTPAPAEYESCETYGKKDSGVGPHYETGHLQDLAGFTSCQAECDKIAECSGWHTHYDMCFVHAPMGTVNWQGYKEGEYRQYTGYKSGTQIVMHHPFGCAKKKGWVDNVDPKYQVEKWTTEYSCGEDSNGQTYFKKNKNEC